MRKLGILFFIIPAICSGQVVFDFENYDLSGWVQCRKSSWDTAAVMSLSGRASLAHVFDNQDAGHDQVSFCIDSLRPDLGEISWTFTVRHGYNPSSANNWAFFLASDEDACEMYPAGKASGYAMGVNYHGSDDLLKLWRISRGKGTVLIETQLNWQEMVGPDAPCHLRVIRDTSSRWVVYYRFDSGDDWIQAGDSMDNRQIIPVYSGLYYEYSSRQDMKLWVDDIRLDGIFLRDTLPPAVDSVLVTGSNQLVVRFTEEINSQGQVGPLNFMADHDLDHPSGTSILPGNEIQLIFAANFPDGIECTLLVSNIPDLKGNLLKTSRHYFTRVVPEPYDVVFNEIMVDPTPAVRLPEYEFIELHNRSDHPVCLFNWQLDCNQSSLIFPDVVADTGSFLLLVHEDAAGLFPDTLHVLPILRSRTTLKNEAGNIRLSDPDGRLIDWLNYTEDWHRNDYFSSGGWSLERIDPARFCGGGSNWQTSGADEGGTPGMVNSVFRSNPDTVPPGILRVELPENDVIQVFYTEPMDSAGQTSAEYYQVTGLTGMISRIGITGPEYNTVLLYLNEELNRDSVFYLEVSPGISDCAGNPVMNQPVRFAVPDFPDSADIVINEILFNPLPGGDDFVELYNASSATYELSDILIATRDDYNDSIRSVTLLDEGHRLFFPDEYLILTENIGQLLFDFPGIPSGCWVELSDLPSFGDKSGTVVLLNRWYEVIDEFSYHADMHFALLASDEGVSLERISADFPANDRNNWHSAAEDAGFATPGYMNSQGMDQASGDGGITVEPEIFSPDNNGIDDYVSIHYHFDQPGRVINVWVFDPRGKLVCKPAGNLMLGTSGRIKWDGTDHLGRRVNTGIYLIYIELFDLNGHVWDVKKTCVLSGGIR